MCGPNYVGPKGIPGVQGINFIEKENDNMDTVNSDIKKCILIDKFSVEVKECRNDNIIDSTMFNELFYDEFHGKELTTELEEKIFKAFNAICDLYVENGMIKSIPVLIIDTKIRYVLDSYYRPNQRPIGISGLSGPSSNEYSDLSRSYGCAADAKESPSVSASILHPNS
jgi:hypothetical protein